MTNKFGVGCGEYKENSLSFKYLGMPVVFKFKNIEMTGKIIGILTYTKRPKYRIEIDDENILCEIYLDKNSFKEFIDNSIKKSA